MNTVRMNFNIPLELSELLRKKAFEKKTTKTKLVIEALSKMSK